MILKISVIESKNSLNKNGIGVIDMNSKVIIESLVANKEVL